eukprot:GHVP01032456.1.p1 GENE.GHVP01032456.1~~GHVP01032456.1.p1  ORF type:complete len:644 (+),score=18.92 GHVP01032456.1:155-2086(+)
MSYKINSQISDIASTNKAPKKGGAIQAPSSYISGQRRNSLPRHAPSPPSSGGLYRTPPRQLSSHSTALILSPRPKYNSTPEKTPIPTPSSVSPPRQQISSPLSNYKPIAASLPPVKPIAPSIPAPSQPNSVPSLYLLDAPTENFLDDLDSRSLLGINGVLHEESPTPKEAFVQIRDLLNTYQTLTLANLLPFQLELQTLLVFLQHSLSLKQHHLAVLLHYIYNAIQRYLPSHARLRLQKPPTLRITSILSAYADSIDPENQIRLERLSHFKPLSPSTAISITAFVNLAHQSLYSFTPPTLSQLNSFFRIAYRSQSTNLHLTLATKDLQTLITDTTTPREFLDILTNITQSSYLQAEPITQNTQRPGQLYTLEETSIALDNPDATILRERTLRSFFNIVTRAAIRKHNTEKSQAHKAITFELTTFINMIHLLDPTIDIIPIIKDLLEKRKENPEIIRYIRIPQWHSATTNSSFSRHRPRNPTDFGQTQEYDVISAPSEDIGYVPAHREPGAPGYYNRNNSIRPQQRSQNRRLSTSSSSQSRSSQSSFQQPSNPPESSYNLRPGQSAHSYNTRSLPKYMLQEIEEEEDTASDYPDDEYDPLSMFLFLQQLHLLPIPQLRTTYTILIHPRPHILFLQLSPTTLFQL